MRRLYTGAYMKLTGCFLFSLVFMLISNLLLPNITNLITDSGSFLAHRNYSLKGNKHYYSNHFMFNGLYAYELKHTGKTNKNASVDKKQHTSYESFQHALAQIGDIHKTYSTENPIIYDQDLGLLTNPETRTCSQDGPGRLEDFLCMEPIKFLPKFKNPCWYTSGHLMVCLPYFLLIGISKCGTSDLFHKICEHPDVLPNSGDGAKETRWWSRERYGYYFDAMKKKKPGSFETYLGFFAKAAAIINKTLDLDENHYMVTGDGSPMDFWDHRFWTLISQNSGLLEPKVLTPHLLRHVIPDAKLIVIFRDLVDRMYSDYWFRKYPPAKKTKSVEFHSTVLKSIDILHGCTRLNSLRWCLYNYDTIDKFQHEARLNIGFYSVYLKEWLKVFPQDQFLFVQTEEYSKAVSTQMKRIFKFMELRNLTEEEMNKVVHKSRANVTKKKKDARPMLEETRRVLHELYDPFSIELAEMLNDVKYAWNVTIAQ